MPVWIQIIFVIGIGVGLSIATRSMYQSTHTFIPFNLIFYTLTGLWAAWDSTKIDLRKYKTLMSWHPALIALCCILLWLVIFPLYLLSRDKVVKGTALLKDSGEADGVSQSGLSSGRRTAYVARLAGFAALSLSVGAIVLFCLFSPRINPSFINSFLFRTDMDYLDGMETDFASPAEVKFIKEISTALKQPFTPETFKNLGLEPPEEVTFKTADGVELTGWFFHNPEAQETVLLTPDGSWGKKFPVLLGYINILNQADYSTFIYDFRAHSANKGGSDTQNALTDAEAAYDYLVKQRNVDANHLILMGSRLGAYISARLGENRPCLALVLEDPWTNLKAHVDSSLAVAMRVIPLSMYPGDGLDTTKTLRPQHPPVLIAASSMNRSGPFEIFEQLTEPKQYVRLVELDTIMFPDLKASAGRYSAKLKSFHKDLTAKADRTKSGAGNSTKSGSGEESSAGSGEESGAGASAESGAGSGAGASAESGAGSGAGASAESGAGSGAGASAESGAGSGAESGAPELKWEDSFEHALRKAEKENKLVLVDFYTDWCGWCKVMDRETYENPDVRRQLARNFISVKVNAEDATMGKPLADKYSVVAFPTVIVVNARGEVQDKMRGFVKAKPFLMELRSLAE